MIQPTVATIFALDLPAGVRFDGVMPGHPAKLCFTLIQTDAQGGRVEDFTLDISALTTDALRRFAAARQPTPTPQ